MGLVVPYSQELREVGVDEASLKALRAAGMSIARLNGSHSDLDWHRKTIAIIRSAVPDVAILLDIPGRKIRTTALAHEPSFKAGDTVILTTDVSHDGSAKVPVNYERLHEDLKPGNVVLADDGTGELQSLVHAWMRGRLLATAGERVIVYAGRLGVPSPEVRIERASDPVEGAGRLAGPTKPD